MEDTIVCKGHYAYMFRVDLSCNQESKLQIENWLEINNFSNWHGCHEIGTETGKHHYQMCVWREHKYKSSEQTKARNWWRGKTNSKTHGAALSSARKILSLVSYSCKDKLADEHFEQFLATISNLSKDQLGRIPKWESKTAAKIQNLEKFEKELEIVMHPPQEKEDFVQSINKIYYKIYNRPCLHRNTYIKYLYKYGYVNDYQIVQFVFAGSGLPGSEYPNEK